MTGVQTCALPIYLDRRGEPAQIEAIVPLWDQEGGFREIHFARHIAHPLIGAGLVEYAHRGGISGKRAIGERIDLDDSNGHNLAE